MALVGLTLLWFAFPPVGFWWLAFLAPIPLIWLAMAPKTVGRRPYWQLYFAGMIYWLAQFYFVPIPHPALWLAWIVLAVYLAVYIPLFVGVSRVLIHDWKLPGILVAPVAWTGLEWIRGHFATGHSFACLSHTVYKQPLLIQIADIFGAYTITFAIVWLAAALAIVFTSLGRRLLGPNAGDLSVTRSNMALNLLLGLAMLVGILVYGNMRLSEPIQFKNDSIAKMALIQTSYDVVFRQLTEEEQDKQFDDKRRLTHQAREQWNDLNLILWPESGFVPFTDFLSDYNEEVTVGAAADAQMRFWSDMTGFPARFSSPIKLLTGGHTVDPENNTSFNSAFLISTDGITDRYYKNHLVMVGEYVPLGKQIPILEELAPMRSLTAGTEFKNISINGVNLAPNICFESTVPHFIHRQVKTLTEQGTEPDVLINLTNDGWFFGTSCLDLHLACNVMRAVELRLPHLVASNTGFSANIDTCGRIVDSGPRRAEAFIRAVIQPIDRTSFYRKTGEWMPMAFGLVCVLGGLIGFWKRRFGTGN